MKGYHNTFFLSIDPTRSQCISISRIYYMQKKLKVELLPLDTKLERTLRNLKKVRSAESAIMTEQQETHQNILALAIERPQRLRTMEDFWRPVIRDEYSSMRQPTIGVKNFEFKPALIIMVQ